MQSNALNSTATDLDLAVNDLGPLAWVLDELRKSLDGAAKALKRFVRDAEAARGSDLAAIDASQLRIARQQLHQAVGALEMVGLAGPALVLRAMEAAVQKFIQQPEQCNQDAAAKIERASFALTEYLEAVLADKPISAVSLFPQYREVQELVRADRIHPADLWPNEWRWIEPELSKSVAPVAYNDAGRSVLDQSVLQIMKGDGVRAGESLLVLCLGFAANQADRQPRIFWKIAAAYFEALAHGLLGSDIYIRRAASRILLQYASLSKGNHGISERLAHDLLFFCSQAVAARATDTPVLSAVRAAYGLARFKPVDYEAVQFGRFDPALLAQARKRIVSAKETWSSLSAGDANKFKQVVDQFSLVSDSLVKLHPPSEPLAHALTRAIDMTARSGHAPGIELAMEVATSVLYLEAAFDDLDPRDPQLAERTRHLAERLESVRAGGQPQPLESWMEELYRRVSDKQTMGSVVGELRISLGELEKSLDLFFRNPQDKAVLRNVPGQLSQMRGVLSVLGLEQASQAVLRMRDSVEQMLVTEIDEQRARAAGTFDQLGNNLGALSFLIDMLNYQPVLAKKLFVYDNEKGELKPLMGRSHKYDDPASSVTVPGETLSQEVIAVVQEADSGASEEKLTDKLDTLATHAALAGQSALAQTAHKASIAVSGHNQEATANALTSLVSSVAPIPAPPAEVEAENFEEDDLRDIFLEEAREVAVNGQEALRILAKEPGDIGQLTVLRRVFHTLKGSSRMVGLNEFGEAAWSLEQMLNGWLADQKPSTEELRMLSAEALTGFSLWIEDISSNKDRAWVASSFRSSADAMRVEGRYVRLTLPPTKLPEPAPTPAVVELPQAIVPVAEPALTAFAAFEAFEALEAVGIANTSAAPVVVFEAVPVQMPVLELEAIAIPTAQVSETVEPVKAVELLQIAPVAEPALVVVTPTAVVEEEILDFDVMFDMTPPIESKAPDAAAPAADVPDVSTSVKTEIAEDIQGIDFDSLAILSASREVESVEGISPALVPEVPVVLVVEASVLPVEPEAAASVDVLELSAADFDAQFLVEADSTPVVSEPSIGEAGSPVVMYLAGSVDQAAITEAVPAEPVEPVFDDVDSSALTAPVVEMLAQTPELLAVPVAEPEPVVVPVAEVLPQTEDELDAAFTSDDSADEQVKVIGSLRIGIPLYNVYLNEADEWSRRLVTEVSEWTIERHHPINDSTVALAHSLAGSSATVGFEALSEIARALENALQQAQAHHSSDAVVAYSGLFVDAAEDIRRLLHQFAAGFLKTPDAHILERLRHLEFAESASLLPNDDDEFGFSAAEFDTADADSSANDALEVEAQRAFEVKQDLQTSLIDLSVTQVIALPSFASSSPVEPAQSGEPAAPLPAVTSPAIEHTVLPPAELSKVVADTTVVGTSAPEIDLPEATAVVQPAYQAPVAPVSLAVTAAEAFADDEDDEIDAVDAIDPELFPIFDEEASELMPQLGGALRQWSSRPGDLGARMEVLRVLHTLKGSARLAGALRLGEMAHRIESEIEYLGSDSAESQDFDPLLTRFDAMQLTLEVLRRADQPGAETSPVVPEVVRATAPETAKPVALAEVQPSVGEPTAADATAVSAAAPAIAGAAPATAPASTGRVMIPAPQAMAMQPLRQAASASIRVKSQLLDRMVNQAGEVMITRSRLEVELNQLRASLSDMNGNLNRLRQQLRDIEVQAESQIQSRLAQAKEAQAGFDPLEFDRFTRVQELTRMMAESVNDVATVQRTLQRTVEATEDDLIAQARQTRELQRDLLRTRMVEFEGISDRLYRVVRQASKETGKQVRLDLLGGTIEMDRGMLDRMTPAFEHLLRNCVAHGIESPEVRAAAGKDPVGLITVNLRQEGNDVSVDFSDDGAGLNLARIREKAVSLGMVPADQVVTDSEAANLIFLPGFSTASQVTELAGRGIGMDVVRSEVNGVGGRIETSTVTGGGTHFKLVLPLTTAVTQVVMLRAGNLSVGVPATVVETVRRATAKELQQAYNTGTLDVAGEAVPFFWSGALLQASHRSADVQGKTTPVVIFRSAAQRIALHVDEVLGNQEVVVKNLGPQLSRLPGLAGMSVLASGVVVLIYNPVALASIYGEQARAWSRDSAEPHMLETTAPTASTSGEAPVRAFVPVPVAPKIPLIMVVDDSITVRRVTQRLLQREGYRVVMAADGLQALERLQEELPVVVLSDIEMPRMDGFDLARNIRADARLRKLPIVMITSRIAEKHRDHAKELGVDHYLGKPYAEEELMSLVRHYCNVEVAV